MRRDHHADLSVRQHVSCIYHFCHLFWTRISSTQLALKWLEWFKAKFTDVYSLSQMVLCFLMEILRIFPFSNFPGPAPRTINQRLPAARCRLWSSIPCRRPGVSSPRFSSPWQRHLDAYPDDGDMGCVLGQWWVHWLDSLIRNHRNQSTSIQWDFTTTVPLRLCIPLRYTLAKRCDLCDQLLTWIPQSKPRSRHGSGTQDFCWFYLVMSVSLLFSQIMFRYSWCWHNDFGSSTPSFVGEIRMFAG